MNEWNVGVDVVDIARFRQLDYSGNKRFYERIFTMREIQHCLSFKESAPRFAANFAAKEAVYKAISRFYEVKLNEVEVLRDGAGAPYVNLRPLNKEVDKGMGSRKSLPFEIKVSLSHSASYAVAFAVVSCSQRAIRNLKLRIGKRALT